MVGENGVDVCLGDNRDGGVTVRDGSGGEIAGRLEGVEIFDISVADVCGVGVDADKVAIPVQAFRIRNRSNAKFPHMNLLLVNII